MLVSMILHLHINVANRRRLDSRNFAFRSTGKSGVICLAAGFTPFIAVSSYVLRYICHCLANPTEYLSGFGGCLFLEALQITLIQHANKGNKSPILAIYTKRIAK